eukprot:s3651_g6.t1
MDVHVLEPKLVAVESITLLCEVTISDEVQRTHYVRTALKGIHLTFHGYVLPGATVVLIVGAQVQPIESSFRLVSIPSTQVFVRPPVSLQSMRRVAEICSGAGFLGFGLEHCGFEVVARCDHNQAMLNLAQQLHPASVMLGDACSDDLIKPLCDPDIQAGSMAAGVSCQPYSALGDQQIEKDDRSLTLPRVLRLAFLLRVGALILECVKEAHTCEWVQSVIRAFAAITGYHLTQGTLHLHQILPARRSRWWCIISHPAVGIVPWIPMPVSSAVPIIADLLDAFLKCKEEDMKFLALDAYELGKFAAYGFDQNEVQWKGQMQTSLHSCGSQLGPCPCGCRLFPFTEDRLCRKGLHGLLIRLQHVVTSGSNVYQAYRHIHPAELALLNGMLPSMPWGNNPKMALCALGQIASPIQSTWVGSMLMRTLQQVAGEPPLDPHDNLLSWMSKLLCSRDEVFGTQVKPNAAAFRQLIESKVYATKPVPQQTQRVIIPATPIPTAQEVRPESKPPVAMHGSVHAFTRDAHDQQPSTIVTHEDMTNKRNFATTILDVHGGVTGFENAKR